MLLSNRANAYVRTEAFDDALADAEACVKLRPQWSKAHARRGAALGGLGRHAEAHEAYERAQTLDATGRACTCPTASGLPRTQLCTPDLPPPHWIAPALDRPRPLLPACG